MVSILSIRGRSMNEVVKQLLMNAKESREGRFLVIETQTTQGAVFLYFEIMNHRLMKEMIVVAVVAGHNSVRHGKKEDRCR
jgi:hypothetical protein